MDSAEVLLALDGVYGRTQAQRYVSKRFVDDLDRALAVFDGAPDMQVVERWLSYLSQIAMEMMQLPEKDARHFHQVHVILCERLLAYLKAGSES